MVPGAGHVQAYYTDNRVYEQTVLKFLATYLAVPSDAAPAKP
jgi:hypothetical protein